MDRERLAAFVRTDYPRVVAALGVVVGDPARAEDAVQDALATALDHRGSIHDLPGWVFAAARNRVRSGSRRRGAERRALERVAGRRTPDGRDVDPTLDDGLVAEVRRLPERQREIVVLHYLLDLSVADVATTLGVTDGTVKTQLHRARTTLRERLGDDGPATAPLPTRTAASGPVRSHDDEEADHVGR
jgi:RNA polymerase sigma-70 factor (ECF subfamily)